MLSRILFATIAVFAVVAAADREFGVYEVTTVSPTNAHFRGRDLITIKGVGFRTFSQVACLWNHEWSSFDSRIVDDNTIVCETPVLDYSEISALPFTTTLSVVFDGDSSINHIVTDNFVFGPALVSFSPASGFVGGGEKFTVKGARFSDFKSAAIYFDGKACLSTIIRNDTDIICVVPAGSYDQDAMVTVVFDGQEKTYLHFENTYHYGPVISTILPPCGNFQGGSRVTLAGSNFADPVLGSTVPPVGALPTVEVVFNSRRYFGLDVTFDGSFIVFTTPFIDDNTFGQDVDIYVHFKGINSKVTLAATSFKFRYGPIVYNSAFLLPYLVDSSSFQNPVPSSGHRAGGDIIAIYGCGFSNFTTGQISPILDVNPNPREFCIRGPNGPGGAQDTLIVTGCGDGNVACERILCYSAPFDCEPTDVANGLSVEFRAPSDRFQTTYVLPPPEEDSLSFKLGPVVTSIDKNRGRWTGGETITVTGVNFFSNGLVSSAADPGWTVTAVFADANEIEDPVTVTVKVVSDTKMTFVTPQMPFNFNALVNFNFDSTCENLPRIPFTFTFGPSCTTLTPPNDILSGGRPVTISGIGFTEDGVSSVSNIEVRLCNNRLNDDSCDVYEVPQVTSVSNTAITFVTSSLRDGISTTVGGNRLFGDSFEVQVLFNGVGTVLEDDSVGLLSCDDFRFGPVTSAISPQKGPTGPRGVNSPGTKVTITGTAFNDPVYNQNIRVAIDSGNNGYIFNNAAKIDGFNDQTKDRRITFSTVWGGVANTDADVITVFNTCNTTVSDFTVNWGPVITSISGLDGAAINPAGNPNLDVYGALPEGGQEIVVNGLGFNDFPGDDDDFAIRCLIDGVQVSTSTNDDGSQVTCTLPPRSFNTVVNVTLEFGYICGDSDLPFNYLQSLTATQRVFYRPRIISISPDYGLTSGGQQVTFTGEGFNGWDTYICYFGQYSNLQVATVNDDGTTVTCSTPYHRAEFNTDVSAHILLSGIHPSRKVISPVTYHYGPVCSEVLPSVATIAGGNAANINGDGFIDCQDSGPNSPFLNCTFVDVQVAFNYTLNKNNSAVFANNTGITSTTVGFFAPAAVDGCGERPVVSLYFPDAIVSDESRRYVQCTNDDFVYHYGPLVTGYSSQYFRLNTAYGWTDTQVTITGLSLADPSLGQPTCQFGNTTGTTVSVTDESVICAAPENKWDVVVEVSLNYGNSCKTQDTVAGLFHYGPVIDSISPDFGYVAGETPVTFTGFAFECCGITQYECMFPGNLTDNFSYPTTFAGNTVTCNVPANEKIDVLFNNVGVRFGGSFFTGNDSYHTLTEDNEVLRYYYGPIVSGITPDRASLSGEGDSITILGAGFDDPYFDAEVLCDFFTKTNGFNGTTTASSVDFDSIVCPVPTFNHRCGDFDDIRPRWGRSQSLQQLRPEQGASYWKTGLPARSAARPVLPFSSDGGSTRPQFYGPVVYGPEIISVQSADLDGGINPISESATAIRTRIDGGVFVTVTFDDIQDWVDQGSEDNFGSEFAWCLFGNRGSPSLSVITPGSNSITCEIPSGAWRFSGQLSVILDPHADFDTTLTTLSDQYWHWLPFATNVNKNLAGPKGYESIVVTGAGFCQYDSVVCTFGNTQGVQADIVNDYRVVCQSPPAAPGLAPLTLTFCSGSDCSAVSDNALNTIPVLETFTIAGITNISPREGPRCGGTNLTITGAGFSLFERLTCRFNQGRFESAATLLSDGSAYCITPDTTSEAVSNPVSCVDVALVGRFKDTADIVFESPVTFEIGTPIVFASDPTSAWLEVKTEVVVIGEYFNGDALNIQEGKYKCVFGDLDPIPAEFYYFTEDDNELKTAIVCDTPTIFSEPDLKTGTVDLEIIFACNDAKATVNKLPFTFFQKPDIDDFTPKEGAEVGGTQVVVTGEHLAGGSGYFCSFGTFGIDNQVVSAVWDPVEATITCVSPSNVVSTNVLVDFAISVDGGKTFVRAEEPFQYEDVTRVCGNNDAPGDNPNVPLVPINSSSLLAPSFLLALLAVAFSRLFLF
jgi:hypothetical protein